MGKEVAQALLDHGGQRMSLSLAQQGLNLVALKVTEKQSEEKRKAILTAYGLGSTVGVCCLLVASTKLRQTKLVWNL